MSTAVAIDPEAYLAAELADLEAEAEAREAADLATMEDHEAVRDLAAFVRLLWDVLEPGTPLSWNWHLDTLCTALQRQVEGDPEYRKLLLCIPPGCMKSLLVSVFAPAWEWLRNPHRRKLNFANDGDLVKRDSRKMRDLMTSETYQRLLTLAVREYGGIPWVFAHDQNEKHNFENDCRGFRQGYSLKPDSPITGKRGDDITIDDPLDAKKTSGANSDAVERYAQDVLRIIKKAIPSRVNNRKRARWTIVMQRLLMNDPAAWAIARGDFHIISIQMEYDPGHEHNHPDDPRTEPGELLFPELFPQEEVDLLKSEDELGAREYSAQYQQRPIPATGGMFHEGLFKPYFETPEEMAALCEEVWNTSDAAQKKTAKSDFYSILTIGRRGQDFYLLRRDTRRMTAPEYERAMDAAILWALPYKLVGVLVEDTAGGAAYLQHFNDPHEGRAAPRAMARRAIPLLPFLPGSTPGKDKSKKARAIHLQRIAAAGHWYLPAEVGHTAGAPRWLPWAAEWLAVVCGFPFAPHDDDLDAASQLCVHLAVEQGNNAEALLERQRRALGLPASKPPPSSPTPTAPKGAPHLRRRR